MAVKIRLKRMGKIRAPYYRIVVADSRTKRDGRVIEEIGKYHPTEEPSFIEVQSERALYWLGVGAQPSPQVEAILKLTGDWGIFKGDKNAKSTVKYKEAKVEFQADEKKKPVLKPKSEKPAPKAEEPAAEAEPAAVAETAAVAEPVEVPVDTVPVDSGAVEADAAADQVRAEEADESTTTTVETPEQVDNSDAPAAAAAEPEATDAEAVAEAAAEPVEAVADETPAEA
ncbi:MAG: small subunit ribosomal protein [Actinomycetota bacterium]|nr:small subunit ribosomal protein [Actinomycetota bacterium]